MNCEDVALAEIGTNLSLFHGSGVWSLTVFRSLVNVFFMDPEYLSEVPPEVGFVILPPVHR